MNDYATVASPTVHLRRSNMDSPVCGRASDEMSSDYREVTCGSCARTGQYVNAVWESQQAQREAEGQILAKVTEILGGLAETLNNWANEAGHCDTYDEAVSEANMFLGRHGLSWPERKQRFEVSLRSNGSTIEAEDDDEAYERIARNIRDYISLY